MIEETRNEAEIRILIAEDEVIVAEDLSMTLRDLGYEVAGIVSSGEGAIRLAKESKPALILMDIRLTGEIDGIEASERIQNQFDIPVIFVTAFVEENVASRAKLTGPYGYLAKPFSQNLLRITIETALYKHRADKRVRESEARRAKAEELAGLHSWEWDIRTGHLVWSAESYRAFGLDPHETKLTFDTFISSVHPEDRDSVNNALRDALDNVRPHDLEFRIVRPDGQERIVQSRGEMQLDAMGRPIRMQGMALDITDRRKAEMAFKESEAKYRAIFRGASEGIVVADPLTAHIKYANPAACAMFGYTEDELIKLSVHDIHPRDKVDCILEKFQATATEGKSKAKDIPCLRKNGTIFFADIGGASITIDGESCNVGFFSDTTERKMVQIALQEKTNLLTSMINALPDMVYFKDVKRRHLLVNRAYEVFWGVSGGEVIGKKLEEIIPPDRAEEHSDSDEAVIETEAPLIAEHSWTDRKGDIHILETRKFPILDANGNLICVGGIGRDITDQRQLHEAFLHQKQELQTILDSVPAVVLYKNADNRIINVNKTCLEAWNLVREDVIGTSLDEFLPPPLAQGAHRVDKEVIRSGQAKRGIFQEIEIRGRTRWYLTDKVPYRDENGTVQGVIVFSIDITDLKKAEAALLESEEAFRSIFEHSIDGILLTAPDGRIFKVNDAACQMFGRTKRELCELGRDVAIDTGDPRWETSLQERLKKGWGRGELNCRRKDGTIFPAEISSSLFKDSKGNLRSSIIMRDVTDRKKMEDAFRESEEKCRLIFSLARDAIALIDVETLNFVDGNDAALQLWGYTKEELVGMSALAVSAEAELSRAWILAASRAPKKISTSCGTKKERGHLSH